MRSTRRLGRATRSSYRSGGGITSDRWTSVSVSPSPPSHSQTIMTTCGGTRIYTANMGGQYDAAARPGEALRATGITSVKVSVVVVNHNEGTYLQRTVQNLLPTLSPEDDLIVVDD